jgi:hypothetical protein
MIDMNLSHHTAVYAIIFKISMSKIGDALSAKTGGFDLLTFTFFCQKFPVNFQI